MTRITIEQHLAWPETRIEYLVTWLNRQVEGWDNSSILQSMYHWIALAEDQEAHF